MKFIPIVWLLLPTLVLAQTPDTTKTHKYVPPVKATPPVTDPLVLVNQLNNIQNYANINTQIKLVDNRYEGLRGTPYLVPDWSKGNIELMTGKVYADVPIKFDAASQNLVMLRPANKDSIIVFAGQIKQFTFQDADSNTFVYRRFPTMKTDDNVLKTGYFQILYAGKNILLKRTAKTFRKADYQQAYSANIRYDSYQDDVTYYLLRPDQTLTKLRRSKKPLFDALGGDQQALNDFASREKLSFKTDADMAKIVQFADQ